MPTKAERLLISPPRFSVMLGNTGLPFVPATKTEPQSDLPGSNSGTGSFFSCDSSICFVLLRGANLRTSEQADEGHKNRVRPECCDLRVSRFIPKAPPCLPPHEFVVGCEPGPTDQNNCLYARLRV